MTTDRRRWLGHFSRWVAAASLAPALHAVRAGPASAGARGSGGRADVLVVGDSLSAEYGLARGSGWVALLEKRLAAAGIDAEVANASISGDTTAGGRSRLPALLARHRPRIVVLELGGNDALRGLPLASTRDNLRAMAKAARAAGARVVVVGMQIPPNFGRRYADDFAAVFADTARTEGAALVPFLLAGVADVADPQSQFQADRIHPLASAHPRMLDNVWAVLGPMLKAK